MFFSLTVCNKIKCIVHFFPVSINFLKMCLCYSRNYRKNSSSYHYSLSKKYIKNPFTQIYNSTNKKVVRNFRER